MKHQEIIELLPWYVNATLDQQERDLVASHLEGCSECAKEVRSLTAIRKAVIAAGDQAPEPSPRLMDRALADIENYERSTAQAESRKSSKPNTFRERIRSLGASWWPATPVFARFAMAAQLAALVVVGALAIYQHSHPNIVYKSLSETPGQETGNPAKARISVGFRDKASAREIRQALSEISGTIVDGPSPLGLYTVQLPFASDQSAEVDKAVQKLLQNQRVVSFAAAKP
jgi:hypothetical protein